jgi:hypothetical protein
MVVLLNVVVAGAAGVGVQDRRSVRGVLRCLALEPVLEDGGDALVIERADLHCAGGDRLRSGGIDAAIEAQDAEAGTKPLLRMWPSGQHAPKPVLSYRAVTWPAAWRVTLRSIT